jgi:hypothetical protein
MKKLTKKSLDELAEAMSVIPENEQKSYLGMYFGDCFWRCVAYIQSGGSSYSETSAASYALGYWTEQTGCAVSADYLLSNSGAGMDLSSAKSYVQANSMGAQIIYVDPSKISWYGSQGISSMGTHHAIVVTGANKDSNGIVVSYNVFDPQNAVGFTISLNESGQGNSSYWIY